MKRSEKVSLVALVLFLALPSMAAAQASRTWVSGVGDDANPCSRTAPCKTFAGAISKTAAGGEISVLDPGGFGAVTITKAITLDGVATLASILVSGTNAIVVAAGPSDVVILRSLSLVSVPSTPGVNGILYQSGSALVVENSSIDGFAQNGIDMQVSTGGHLVVRNASITGGSNGVRVGGGGTPRASLTGVTIKETTNSAIDSLLGATDVNNSIVAQNGNVGLLAEGGILNAESVTLTGNGIATWVESGATIRLSNSGIFDNLSGLGCGGGILASAGNNRVAGNAAGSCAPNASIPVQ